MRTLLLASLALTSTLWQPVADACGGYGQFDRGPAVYRVSTHTVPELAWQRRAFVLLGPTSVDANLRWERLAPMTFDTAYVADASDLPNPYAVTLIGPSGSTTIKTAAVSSFAKWRDATPMRALDVNVGRNAQFVVAVAGEYKSVRWIEVEHLETTKEARAWAKTNKLDGDYVYVSRIKGTTIELVAGHLPDQIETATFVRGAGTGRGATFGTAIGAIDLDGARYVLVERDGMVTPIAV